MRLATRLSIILGVTIAAVVLLNEAWSLSRQVDEMEQSLDSRMTAQATVLVATLREAWRVQGEDPARALLPNVRLALPGADVRWMPVGPQPVSFAGGAEAWAALMAGNDVPVIRSEDRSRALKYVAVIAPGTKRVGGVVELVHMVRRYQTQTWDMVAERVGKLGVVLLLLIFAVWVAIRRLVAEPLSQLTELARRVGESDFSARVLTRRNDEVGRLARQMNRMTEQLQTAREDAERAARAKVAAMRELRHAERLKTVGQLGSGIAHELGTPLNVVIGRAKMIVKGYVEGPDLVESAEVIVAQGDRMTALIKNLLTFARRERARTGAVDFEALVTDTRALLHPLLHKRQAIMVVGDSVSQPPSPIEGDDSALQQVLTNLVMNAVDAGATRVEVDVTEDERRPPGATMAVPVVVLSVTDDGPGMPPDVANHIFDPFFTTKPVGEGTGLGLSIAYGIVEDHRGWIEFETTEGQGTMFRVCLPKA